MSATWPTILDLRYSEKARCPCGAGLAYPFEPVDIHGSWTCSRVLLGEVMLDEAKSEAHRKDHPPNFLRPSEAVDEAGVVHIACPFVTFEINSEDQPSAQGRTTRPTGTHAEHEPRCKCKRCGAEWTAKRRRPGEDGRFADLVCSCGASYVRPESSVITGDLEVRWHTVVVADAEVQP